MYTSKHIIINQRIRALRASAVTTLFLIVASLLPAVSSASVIYFDDFTGMNSGTGDFTTLNNRTPPTTTGGAQWNSAGYVSDDGVDFVRMTTTNKSAILPFSPEAGYLYTFTVMIGHSGGSGTEWGTMGFNTNESVPVGNATSAFNHTPSPGINHVALRQNGSFQWWEGAGTAGTSVTGSVSGYTANNFYEFRLELDTRPANWTLDLFVAGNQVDISGASSGLSHVYGTNPDIKWIQLSNNATTAIFDSVELTVIPEPGTLLLVGLFGLAVVALRRRKPN
jgi:hypothetical protein